MTTLTMRWMCAGLCLLGVLCAAAQEPVFQLTPHADRPEENAAPEGEAVDLVEQALQTLDLRTRIAQLMFIAMQGRGQPRVDDLAILKNYPPGGVVIKRLFKEEYAAAYVGKLRASQQVTGIPIWIAANMYWLTKAPRGAPSTFTQLPTPLSVAAAGDTESIDGLAHLLGRKMHSMGFNMHFGPSFTLGPTLPDAPGSIYTFGSDKDFVATAAERMLPIFQRYGVLPVPLGFPGGLENSEGDGPAVLLTPPTTLKEQDLAPYMRAIQHGAPMLHVGNVLTPTLGAGNRPASVSGAVLQELLRGELDYDGVVIAGPMDSSVITQQYDTSEAALLALANGADMLYWHGPPKRMIRAVDNIAKAVEKGRLDEDIINAAVRRVLTVKNTYYQDHPANPPEESTWSSIFGSEDRKTEEAVYEIERRSITLAQNRDGILPLSEARSMPIGITGVVGVVELTEYFKKHIKKVSQQPISTAQHLGEIKDFEIERITSHVKGLRTMVLVLSEEIEPRGARRLIHELHEEGIRVVVVLLGYPRHLPYYASAEAILLAYSDAATYNLTMHAVSDVLIGRAPLAILDAKEDAVVKAGQERLYDVRDVVRAPAGQLPVTLSETFSAGAAVPYSLENALKKARWDFGNGETRKGEQVEYAYPEPGRYPVTLTVVDTDGAETANTFHVVVKEKLGSG